MFIINYVKNNGQVECRKKIVPQQAPSELVVSRDGHSFYVGCLFGLNPEQLFTSDWVTNPKQLNQLDAALYIVNYDELSCTFATDTTGRELLYYYFDENNFILSDSFWEIMKVVQPSYENLDHEIIGEMIASGGGVPCDNTTPIKNLYWAAPNTLGSFDLNTWSFSLSVFAEVRRTGEIKNLSDAIESMDCSMTRMGALLSSKHSGETFGLGLSGGLDSRIALHYLQKANISPICFNVCVSRPHGLLKATSIKNATVLASRASVDLSIVEWHPETVRSKMNQLLLRQPFGTCGHFTNAYKYEPEGMPRFDILITAGQTIGPALVGVSAPPESDKLSKNDVFEYLYGLCISEVRPSPFTSGLIKDKVRSVFNLSDRKDKSEQNTLWNRIVGREIYESIAYRVNQFVSSRWEKGWRPADITMDYRTSALGAIGRNGAYESCLSKYQSYTIYTPFLVKEGLKWDIPLVENRRILKELLKQKIPQFSDVGEEAFGGIDSGISSIRTFYEKINYLMRGTGIMADEWYASDKSIKNAFYEDMGNSCLWLKEMYPAISDIDSVWMLSPSRRNAVWDLKRLVDCIELKRYLYF